MISELGFVVLEDIAVGKGFFEIGPALFGGLRDGTHQAIYPLLQIFDIDFCGHLLSGSEKLCSYTVDLLVDTMDVLLNLQFNVVYLAIKEMDIFLCGGFAFAFGGHERMVPLFRMARKGRKSYGAIGPASKVVEREMRQLWGEGRRRALRITPWKRDPWEWWEHGQGCGVDGGVEGLDPGGQWCRWGRCI